MAYYETRKNTAEYRQRTIERKIVRQLKYVGGK